MRTCCSGPGEGLDGSAAPAPPRRTWLRRLRSAAGWGLPVTALVMVPKCPMCVAGYVLVFTGVGISLDEAAALRWTLIALSATALGVLVLRAVRRCSLVGRCRGS